MIAVREAAGVDADALARLHLHTVTFAYADIFPSHAASPGLDALHRSWQVLLSDPGVAVWAAARGDEIVGSVVAQPAPDQAGVGQIARLHVDPSCWREGIGTRLLDGAVEHLGARGFDPIELWVLERNERARAFYERHGWRPVPGRAGRSRGPTSG